MHIGVCHAVTLPGEWEEAIAQAGELGFEGIELFLRPPTMADLLDHPERVVSLREAAARARVQLPSLGLVVFGPEFRLTEPDETKRQATIERVRTGVQRCAELGGTIALLPSAPPFDDAPAVAAYVSSLRNLVPTAAQLQVRLGIETGYNADETLAILGQVASEWVGDYFDTGNAAGRGMDPVKEIERRDGHVVQLHVKGVRGASLDEGTVDLAAVKAALQRINYDGWLMLETSAGDQPLIAARHNLEVLRRQFVG